MPITIDGSIRVMTQDEFGAVAFNVMRHASRTAGTTTFLGLYGVTWNAEVNQCMW